MAQSAGLRFTVGRKLAAPTLGGLLVALVVGAVAYINVVSIGQGIKARTAQNEARVGLQAMNRVISDIQIDERDSVLVPMNSADTKAESRQVQSQFGVDSANPATAEQNLRTIPMTGSDRSRIDQVLGSVDA